MQYVRPMAFREAVEKLGERTAIGSKLLSSEWQDVPVALRERAFFSSQVESVRFLQRAQDFVDDFLNGAKETLPNGETMLAAGSRAEFVDQLRGFALKEGMGPLEEEGQKEHGLRDITSERRLGLIFDTQTRQANDYGYRRQGMAPEVLNEFPAQRFIRVQAVRKERETHLRYENQVYLKTDPIWALEINEDFHVPWGPWAWGCGHDVEDVDRDEAEQLGLVKPGEEVQPGKEWGFNEGLQASANGLEPELVDKLRSEFGEQMVIDSEGAMSWRPAAEEMPGLRDDGTTGLQAGGTKVSEGIENQTKGLLAQQVDAAMAAIDRVHGDGDLPAGTPVKGTMETAYGFMQPKAAAYGAAVDYIAVRNTGPWPTFTAVHETGHLLDLEAIGPKGQLASRSTGLEPVMAAAERSQAIQELRRKLATTRSVDDWQHFTYLLKPEEIWARAYSQFVAKRSGFVSLKRDLRKAVAAEKWRQWEDADFGPIESAIEGVFKDLGWMK